VDAAAADQMSGDDLRRLAGGFGEPALDGGLEVAVQAGGAPLLKSRPR
jgi:hypothetical protein